MYKIGQRVRVLRHRNFFGSDNDAGIPRGTIVTLKSIDVDCSCNEFTSYVVEDIGDGWSWIIRSDDIEAIEQGPIRTVTRREIVSGVYGRISIEHTPVGSDGTKRVAMRFYAAPAPLDAEELREAAHLFTQLAEVLEDA